MCPAPECQDCVSAKEHYYWASRLYMDAVRQLDAVVAGPEFSDAYEGATRARYLFEHARDMLNRHLAEHGVPTSGHRNGT
jgi:hypothetical protein